MFRRIRPDTWGHLATAAALFAGVLILGTAGYTVLGLSLIDAAYQTIITVSTVGFRGSPPVTQTPLGRSTPRCS